MTTWIENPRGGRARGPRALVRAWVEVLTRPRRFFENGVGPGDQAPGLTFAMVVAVVYATGWMVAQPSVVPTIAESVVLSAIVVILIVGVLAAPAGLHLAAALATISIIFTSVEYRKTPETEGGEGNRFGFSFQERAGVSETVQVVAYASAPFAFAGPPVPELRLAAGVYATLLLAYGLRIVHDTSWIRASVAAILPAFVGYWLVYGAITGTTAIVERLAAVVSF